MSSYGVNPTTGALEGQFDGMRSLEDIQLILLDMCYPVGSIYISTKNVSPQTFLGGTWKSKSDYVLRGATSGVNFDSDTNDGGADSVTVSSVANHNHTQNQHGHYVTSNSNQTTSGMRGVYADYSGTGSGSYIILQRAVTPSPQNPLMTTYQTATNIANGTNYTVNTLPKYKNVYIWERTA